MSNALEIGMDFTTQGAQQAIQDIDRLAAAETKLTKELVKRAKAEANLGKYSTDMYDEMNHSLRRLTKGFDAADKVTDAYDERLHGLSQSIKAAKAAIKDKTKELEKEYGITQKNIGSIKELIKTEEKLTKRVGKTETAYAKMKKEVGATEKQMKMIVSIEKKLIDSNKKAEDTMKAMRSEVSQTGKAAIGYNRAMEKLNQTQKALSKYQSGHEKELAAYKKMTAAADHLAAHKKMWSDQDIRDVKKMVGALDKLKGELGLNEKELKEFERANKKVITALDRSERKLKEQYNAIHKSSENHFTNIKATNKAYDAENKLTQAYDRQIQAMRDLKRLRENLRGKGLSSAAAVADKEFKALEASNLKSMAEGAVYGHAIDTNKIKAAEKALAKTDKTIAKFNKRVRKGTSIFNTWFGRMSMVMTSIAATIFVIQNLIRWIRAFYDATLDLEKALIKVKLSVGGTKAELKDMTKAAREASESGYKTTAKNVEEMVKLRKAGYSTATAMNALKIASLEYEQAAQGTLSGDLAVFTNSLKNFTIDLAAIFSQDLKRLITWTSDTLQKVMEHMKRIRQLREGGVDLSNVTDDPTTSRRNTSGSQNWKAFWEYGGLFDYKNMIRNKTTTQGERQRMDSSQGYDSILPRLIEKGNELAEEALVEARIAADLRAETLELQKNVNEDDLWHKVTQFNNTEKASNRRKSKDEGRVVDSDTLVLMIAGKKYSIRFLNVDGPESVASDERRGTKDSFNRIVDNSVAGILASFTFKKMLSGQEVKLDLEGIGKWGRMLGDNLMNKSGFMPFDVMAKMGLVGTMDYENKTYDDPRYTAPEVSERADFAKARLTLMEKKYADYEKKLGLDRGDVQSEYTKPEWQKKTKIKEDLSDEYKAFADLYGFSGAEKQFLAWNKEVTKANQILKVHEEVLKKTGMQSKLYNLTVATQIEDQYRKNIDAGVSPAAADVIRDEATYEAELKRAENDAAKMSEIQVKYAISTEEATMTVNERFQEKRQAARDSEAARIIEYATDLASAEKALKIKRNNEIIEDIKLYGAKQTEIFSKTGMASPEYLVNLENALNAVNDTYLEITGDREGYIELAAKNQVTIAEAAAKKEIDIFAMTNVATAKYLEKRKKIIKTKAAEILAITGNSIAAEVYQIKEINKEIAKAYAERAEVVQAFFSVTGMITEDYYAEEARKINDQALVYEKNLQKQGYKDATGIATAWRNLKLLNLEVKNLRSSTDILRGFELGITGIGEQTKSATEIMYEYGKAVRDATKSNLKSGLSTAITEGIKEGTVDGLAIFESFMDNMISAWSDMLVEQLAAWTANRMKMEAIKAGGEIAGIGNDNDNILDILKNLSSLAGASQGAGGIGAVGSGATGGAGSMGATTMAGMGLAGAGGTGIAGAGGGGFMGSTAAGGMNAVMGGGAAAGAGAAGLGATIGATGGAAVMVVAVMGLIKTYGDMKDIAKKRKAEEKAIRKNLEAINENTAATKDNLTRQLQYARGEKTDSTSTVYQNAMKEFEEVVKATSWGSGIKSAQNWNITANPANLAGGSTKNSLMQQTLETQVDALEIVFLKVAIAAEGLANSIEETREKFVNSYTAYEMQFKTISDVYTNLIEGPGGTEETLSDYAKLIDQRDTASKTLDYWRAISAAEIVGPAPTYIPNAPNFSNSGSTSSNYGTAWNSPGGSGIPPNASTIEIDWNSPGGSGVPPNQAEIDYYQSSAYSTAKAVWDKAVAAQEIIIQEQITFWEDTVNTFNGSLNDMSDAVEEANGINKDHADAVLKAEKDFMLQRVGIWEGMRRHMRTLTGAADELEQALWGVDDQFKGWISQLTDLGADVEEIARVTDLWAAAIQATILNQQISDIEAGGSSIEGLLDRLKGILEARITSGFDMNDWVQIFYRAGASLNLLDVDSYENQSEYWADIVELSTLQLDALNNIITLTEQEIGNLEASKESIASLLQELRGGSLAPVSSVDYVQNRYDALFAAASGPDASSGAINEFLAYVPDYLAKMKEFGVDYGDIVAQAISDVELVDTNVTATLDDLLSELTAIATSTDIVGDTLGLRLDSLLGYISGEDGLGAINESISNDVTGLTGILITGFQSLIADSAASTEALKLLLADLIPDDSEFLPGPNVSDWFNTKVLEAETANINSLNIGQFDTTNMPEDFVMPDHKPITQIPDDYYSTPLWLQASAPVAPLEYPGMATGGLTSGITYAGEKGSEWIIPTYEPERSSFLDSINMSPQSIASEINENLQGGEGGPYYITIEIGGEKFGTAMIQNMKSNREVRKQVQKVSNNG